jgi:beta-glucosidase-like glycosyl hydrolase
VLSKRIVQRELAVGELGQRVTITDDLEVPAVERYRNAAVKALLAGIDILMFAQREVGSEQAFHAITTAIANGAVPESVVLAAAARVDQLKENLGLG